MKFNTTAKDKNVVTNYMGGKAYRLDAPMELYTAVVSTMLDDSYYEKANDRLTRIRKLVAENDPVFVAKL
nr:TROVE domain-containing protein [Cytophagales bacterium]